MYAGLAWAWITLRIFPSVVRLWTGRGDAIDWLASPLCFIGLDQIGFSVRWLIFPGAIRVMQVDELLYWVGLYVLSGLGVMLLDIGYRIARAMMTALVDELILLRAMRGAIAPY